MLKKADAQPGTRIRFRDQFKDNGVPGFKEPSLIPCFPGSAQPGGLLYGTTIYVYPGDEATVVEKPRRIASDIGGNAVKLRKDTGEEGWLFWMNVHRYSDLAK
jgi:hypothetical protein